MAALGITFFEGIDMDALTCKLITGKKRTDQDKTKEAQAHCEIISFQ